MRQYDWINYDEMPPPETGWYKVKTEYGHFEACYAGTLGGIRKWVVPDSIKITHWMPILWPTSWHLKND